MKTKLFIFILLFGFTSLSVWAEGESSIDCATAEADIAELEKQKVSEGGLLSYTPIGWVADAVFSSDEEERKEKAAEEHNSKIDAQIEKIKEACIILN